MTPPTKVAATLISDGQVEPDVILGEPSIVSLAPHEYAGRELVLLSLTQSRYVEGSFAGLDYSTVVLMAEVYDVDLTRDTWDFLKLVESHMRRRAQERLARELDKRRAKVK